MNCDSNKYQLLFENLPDAFACHRIVTDDGGNPVDYIFLEVNQAFEEMTGLKRSEVVGKNVTQVHPKIKKLTLDWIGVYGKLSQGGEAIRFEHYFEPSQRWYEVCAYSDKPGCFITIFRNITEHKETQEKQKNQRDLLQRYLDTTGTIMVTLDRTGAITMINRYGLELLEYAEEQLIGKNWFEVVLPQPEGMEKVYPGYQQIISGNLENVSSFENDILTATGRRRTIAWRNNYLLNNKGNIVGTLSSGMDITERKQMEEDLRKTQFAVDKYPLSVFWISPEGRFIYVNETAAKKLGYSPDELLSMHVWDVDPNYPREKRKEQWSLHRQKGESIFESEHRRRDGTTFPVRVNIYHLAFEGQEMEVAEAEDITERRQAEEKLKKIEWMLSQKQTPDSVCQAENHDQGYGDLIELNSDGIILKYIGPELLRSFSSDYLELLGTSSAIYEANGDYAFGIFASGWCRMMDKASRNLCNTPDNIEALNSGRWLCHESCWTDCSQKAILENTPVDIECNGGIRLYAVPIIASGEVVGAINFGYGDPPENREKLQKLADNYQENYDDLVREADEYESRPPYIIDMAKKRLHATARLIGSLVEKKQAEEEILNLNEKLEQRVIERTAQLEAANRELDAFTHSASHDLRGPLNRISGFSHALLEDCPEQLDQQGRHYLQRINSSCEHMKLLIDDLLKLSRVSQMQISREPVELSVLVNVCLKELKAREPDRLVETVIAPGLVAEGDTALLRITLENLLGNAWKFSAGKNPARIEFGSTEWEEKEVYYIRDNGTGFDMKHAEKLFTAFQRLHDAKAYPGTGVGLSIVSRIINRHGGEIWAEGEVGKGACFYFTLPA